MFQLFLGTYEKNTYRVTKTYTYFTYCLEKKIARFFLSFLACELYGNRIVWEIFVWLPGVKDSALEKLYERYTETIFVSVIKCYTLLKSVQFAVFHSPYFPLFELITDIYIVDIRIQSGYGKTQTRKRSKFGHL